MEKWCSPQGKIRLLNLYVWNKAKKLTEVNASGRAFIYCLLEVCFFFQATGHYSMDDVVALAVKYQFISQYDKEGRRVCNCGLQQCI